MMLSQLNEQQVAELAEKSNAETMKKFNARPGTASNQYLHDLYRFFKLSVRRNEFVIFSKKNSTFIMFPHSTIYYIVKKNCFLLLIFIFQRNVGMRLSTFIKN